MSAVSVIPCLRDNYGFLLHDVSSGETACIDTPEVGPICEEAERRGWRITQVWNTHWHGDHTGGNERLRELTGCKVSGPAEVADRAGCHVDRVLGDGDVVYLGSLRADVMATPGHTLGHICYYIADEGIIFAGDTLFSAGCGRLFEGEPHQMWESLLRLRSLPAETRVYCAHEYTQANLAFAMHVDGSNPAVLSRVEEVGVLRERGVPTIPTCLGDEMSFNPFLRADDADMQKALGCQADAIGAFASLRAQKDVF